MAGRLLVTLCLLTSLAGVCLAGYPYRQHNSTLIKRYKCQSPYKRIGNRCYYFSESKLSWRDSQFACNELNFGYLAKLDRRWKDRKLRNFLNKSKEQHERWIGSIYDDRSDKWIWAKGGEKLRYQGFSQRRPNDNYQWRCVIMAPNLLYRWNTRSCLTKNFYICEIPIQTKAEMKEYIRRRNLNKPRKRKPGYRKKYQSPIETNQII